MRLGFQREQRAQSGRRDASQLAFSLRLSPIAHTVAFGKSSILCLENVAVGLDRHEMPGERETDRERMNRNMNERLCMRVSLCGSLFRIPRKTDAL